MKRDRVPAKLFSAFYCKKNHQKDPTILQKSRISRTLKNNSFHRRIWIIQYFGSYSQQRIDMVTIG